MYIFLLAIVLSVLLRFTDSDSPFSIFKLFLLAITLYHRYIDRNSKMEYGINKVINNPLVGGAWLQAFINTTANSAPVMTTIDLQDSLYTSRQWLNKSMNSYLRNSLSLMLISACCSTWGFAVVIGIRARVCPIHPIGVRFDLNLTILTAME